MHFKVMVIGENPEEQLQAFHEFECDGVDDKYVVDIDDTEYFLEEYKSYKDKYTFEEYLLEYENIESVEYRCSPQLHSKHKYGYALKDENGLIFKVVRRQNPNSKWDYYRIGGRYAGSIKLKDGVSRKNIPNFSWEWNFSSKDELDKRRNMCDRALKHQIENLDEISFCAFLKDGVWSENNMEDDYWENEIELLKDSISDEELITIYDCHV